MFSVKAENRGGAAKSSTNLIVEREFHLIVFDGILPVLLLTVNLFFILATKEQKAIEPPKFERTLQDLTVKSGQLARLDAKVTGTKPLQVFWARNGQEVKPDITHKLLEEDDVHTLLILEVTPEDNGTYECVAVNMAGEARCQSKTVVEVSTVRDTTHVTQVALPPQVIEPLKGVIVPEGQSALFCTRISNVLGKRSDE